GDGARPGDAGRQIAGSRAGNVDDRENQQKEQSDDRDPGADAQPLEVPQHEVERARLAIVGHGSASARASGLSRPRYRAVTRSFPRNRTTLLDARFMRG